MEMPDRGTVLTQEGYCEIKQELEKLLTVKRPALAKRLKEAIALGDLSENFDYHDAKRDQGLMESRIKHLKAILDTATVVECANSDGHVGIGSKVLVRDVADAYEDEYVIVGPPEADPSEGKISYESNVGAALMGCKVGDRVSVETPGGVMELEIACVG
jgi:transcription elongation factor GreA